MGKLKSGIGTIVSIDIRYSPATVTIRTCGTVRDLFGEARMIGHAIGAIFEGTPCIGRRVHYTREGTMLMSLGSARKL